MNNPKESFKKDTPSSRSLDDLMKLLIKLNEKIREKFYPSSGRKKEAAPGRLDLVIMILSQEEAKARPEKKNKANPSRPSSSNWIDRLCQEIENGIHHRRKA